MFREVVGDLTSKLSLWPLESSVRKKKETEWYEKIHKRDSILPACENIVALLRNCYSLDLRSDLDQIIGKLSEEAAQVDLAFFDYFFQPMLKGVADVVPRDHASLQSSPFLRLFRSLLRTYVVRCEVGVEPFLQKDWSRAKVNCG